MAMAGLVHAFIASSYVGWSWLVLDDPTHTSGYSGWIVGRTRMALSKCSDLPYGIHPVEVSMSLFTGGSIPRGQGSVHMCFIKPLLAFFAGVLLGKVSHVAKSRVIVGAHNMSYR